MHCHGAISVVCVSGQQRVACVIDWLAIYMVKSRTGAQDCSFYNTVGGCCFLKVAKLSMVWEASNIFCLWPFPEKFASPALNHLA